MTLDAPKTLRVTYNHHLGNVQATVTDLRQRLWNQGELSSQTSLSSAFDYYPFGMIMPGRAFNADKYRFGYNLVKGFEGYNEFLKKSTDALNPDLLKELPKV